MADDEARREFAENLRENFCVGAGAGVGKTRAIVERIASLARRRADEPDVLSRLVVVTYGKLAAEELRVRTRDQLLSRTERSAFGRQRLLSDLRGAFFGTIHSFCLKLITEHGRFLGLPERPVLLEDREEPALWARFCDSELLATLHLPPGGLGSVSRHLTFDQLLNLARQLDPGEVDFEGDDEDDSPPPSPSFADALADSGGKHPQGRLTTLRHQETLRRWLGEFEDPYAHPFLALPAFSGGARSFLEAVDAAIRPYAEWLDGAAGRLAARIARAWRDYRLERGVMTYRDMILWCRRLLDDPEILRRLRERRLLIILDEAQDTDAEMFAILSELARPVEAEPGAWPEDEDAPGPESGRFSFVGDEQQAIYRERADPAVYKRYVEAYRAGRGGRRLEFSVTMRCPQRVIAAVNAIFGEARLPQEDCEFRTLAERPDCPEGAVWRLDLGEAPAADGDGGGRVNKADRVEAECRIVAEFLAGRGLAGLEVGRWDEVALLAPRIDWLEAAARALTGCGLPSNLLSQKRVARELPAHSWPAALLHVLLNPWDRFELIGVLREVWAVSDVELARWHRGSKLGLGFWPEPDAERVAAAKTPGARRLRDALTLLHELRSALPSDPENARGQKTETVGRFVDFVLHKTALSERLRAVGEKPDALERLRALALQAECDGLALRPWVQGLVDALELPPPAAPDAPEAIQLLTCQKAKGLEWPVVVPLGLGCKISERTRLFPRVERRREGRGFSVHFSSRTEDPAHGKWKESKRRDELQRLLYVTLTRARRLLVLPDGTRLHGGAQDPNFFALARWPEVVGTEGLFAPAPAAAPTSPPGRDASPRRSPDSSIHPTRPQAEAGGGNALPAAGRQGHLGEASLPTGEECLGEASLPAEVRIQHPASSIQHPASSPRLLARAAKLSVRGVPRRILPSSLVHDRVDEARVLAADAAALQENSDDNGTTGGFVGQVGGVDYGDWWHRTVERYPWRGTEEARDAHRAAELARLALVNPAATERAGVELDRLAGSAMHTEFLAAGKHFLPEAPFSYPRSADEWLEGIMDLVVITKTDEVWIIDWKTDRPRPGESPEATLARLADKYGPQLQAYAEVFARGLDRPVTRLLLYSTPLGRTAAVPSSPPPAT